MKKLVPYFIPLICYWLCLAGLLVLYGYKDSFLILNHQHSFLLDYLMYFLTLFGDSLFVLSLLVILFPGKTEMVVVTIVAVIITGLFVQLLKQAVFPDWDRPLKVFEEIDVHTVGSYHLYHKSFPSGHSLTVGCVFTVLAWYFREKKYILIPGSFIAIIVSYTRIYLGSHFPGDVLAGSMLGTLLTLVLLYFFEYRFTHWISQWNGKVRKYVGILLLVMAVTGLIISLLTYFNFLVK